MSSCTVDDRPRVPPFRFSPETGCAGRSQGHPLHVLTPLGVSPHVGRASATEAVMHGWWISMGVLLAAFAALAPIYRRRRHRRRRLDQVRARVEASLSELK